MLEADEGAATIDIDGAVGPPRFHVLRRLGQGGCGLVVAARDDLLKREVAIKFLTSPDEEQVAELVREAQAQARVDHPNVCKIYEIFSMRGRPAITMQLIAGTTLHDAAKGLSPRDKALLVAAVADGIEAANRLGIVHRDLKPSNVLVERTASGGHHPYVTDFGLARELGTTLTGRQIGTPAYMAPEQARGDTGAIGPATDVYGLGATLYAVLCGKPPNRGKTVAEVLAAAERLEPVPLRRVDPALPRELELICARCLEKEPARRYPGAGALAEELRRFAAGEKIAARPRRLRGRRRLFAALAAVAAAAAVAGWLVLRRRPGWTPAVRALGLTYDEWAGRSWPAPDGAEIVYASNRDGHWRLYAESLAADADQSPPRPLTPEDMTVSAPVVTRDGRSILCVVDADGRRAVAQLPRAGGRPTTLAEGAGDVDDCGGGRLLLHYDGAPGCFDCERLVLREANGRERLLAGASAVEYLTNGACDPAGRRVVYSLRRSGENQTQLYLLDLDGGRPRPVGPPLPWVFGAGFHPDGRSLLIHSERNGLLEVSLAGAVTPVAAGLRGAWPVVSADGKRLFYSEWGQDRPVVALTVDGRTRRLTLAMESVGDLGLAPDGSEIFITTTRSGRSGLVAISTADGSWRWVVADARNVAVGAGGREVFFVRGWGPESELWVVARGGGEPRRVAALPGAVRIFAAQDGLHAMVNAGDHLEAWRVPAGGPPAREAEAVLSLPSPDGRHVLLRIVDDAGRPGLLLPAGAPPDDPRGRRFAWREAVWTADGAVVGKEGLEIKRLDVDSGAETVITTLPEAARDALWVVAPDGRTVYATYEQHHSRRMMITNFGDRPRP